MTDLEEKLSKLPASPGVYLFKNERHEIIYVGKAKRLRSRVRSYFRSGSDKRAFYELLVSQVADFDFVVTSSEKDALILDKQPHFSYTSLVKSKLLSSFHRHFSNR